MTFPIYDFSDLIAARAAKLQFFQLILDVYNDRGEVFPFLEKSTIARSLFAGLLTFNLLQPYTRSREKERRELCGMKFAKKP